MGAGHDWAGQRRLYGSSIRYLAKDISDPAWIFGEICDIGTAMEENKFVMDIKLWEMWS